MLLHSQKVVSYHDLSCISSWKMWRHISTLIVCLILLPLYIIPVDQIIFQFDCRSYNMYIIQVLKRLKHACNCLQGTPWLISELLTLYVTERSLRLSNQNQNSRLFHKLILKLKWLIFCGPGTSSHLQTDLLWTVTLLLKQHYVNL